MANDPVEEKPTVQSIAAYVETNAARARDAQQMHHADTGAVREADYKGHHIVIRTRYEVEVDGKPLMGHMGVNDDGAVHYHPVPNLSFTSAIDMVKKIIDVFPADFAPGATPDGMGDMGSGAGSMPGMAMHDKPAGKKASKPRAKGKQ